MREEDCMNAARRVSEREGASQITLINSDRQEARGHSRSEWGRAKTNTLPAGLPDFCFFSANPSLLGAIRANPKNPWLDFQKMILLSMILPERVEGFSATGGVRPAFNAAQNLLAGGPQRTNPRLNLASAGRREKSLHCSIGLHGPWQGVDYLAREIAPQHRFPFL